MNNKRGFTVISLVITLVVITILGVVGYFAVSKYVNQSRRKTIVSLAESYIAETEKSVNNLEYVFTGANTIYALPIECISFKNVKKDPFGEWYPASDTHWGYVLVQYNDLSSNYTYGFTFKDDASYGMIPMTVNSINSKGKDIVSDFDLTRPVTGSAKNYSKDWIGFRVDNETKLQVLIGIEQTGNGYTTCMISQD